MYLIGNSVSSSSSSRGGGLRQGRHDVGGEGLQGGSEEDVCVGGSASLAITAHGSVPDLGRVYVVGTCTEHV